MKKYLFAGLVIAGFAAIFLFAGSSTVDAISPTPTPSATNNTPAAGNWMWDDADVMGTVIPQYKLAETVDEDYALLQSNGLRVDGAAEICHPYPGGQSGWTAEIRVMTNSGWQPVPTVNQWVPDEEGQYMTCAQVWSGGTYAVFGYWEKPEGWSVEEVCVAAPPANYSVYVGPASTFSWFPLNGWNYVGGECTPYGGLVYPTLADGYAGINLPVWGYYCSCDSIYMDPHLAGPVFQ